MSQTNGTALPAPDVEILRSIARLTLDGIRPDQIAKIVNLDPPVVLSMMMSGYFASALEYARKHMRLMSVEESLQAHAPVALRTMVDVMHNGSNKERANVAVALLDRAGHSPKQRHDVNFRGVIATAHLTEDDLRTLVLRRIQSIRGEENGT